MRKRKAKKKFIDIKRIQKMTLMYGLNHAKKRIAQGGVDNAKAKFITDLENKHRATSLSPASAKATAHRRGYRPDETGG